MWGTSDRHEPTLDDPVFPSKKHGLLYSGHVSVGKRDSPFAYRSQWCCSYSEPLWFLQLSSIDHYTRPTYHQVKTQPQVGSPVVIRMLIPAPVCQVKPSPAKPCVWKKPHTCSLTELVYGFLSNLSCKSKVIFTACFFWFFRNLRWHGNSDKRPDTLTQTPPSCCNLSVHR